MFLCSLAAQGLFINLCSYYWQKLQTIKDQFLKLKFRERTRGLIAEVIDLIDNDIYINFLDVQYEVVVKKSNQ
jgi:hypothetical protein